MMLDFIQQISRWNSHFECKSYDLNKLKDLFPVVVGPCHSWRKPKLNKNEIQNTVIILTKSLEMKQNSIKMQLLLQKSFNPSFIPFLLLFLLQNSKSYNTNHGWSIYKIYEAN